MELETKNVFSCGLNNNNEVVVNSDFNDFIELDDVKVIYMIIGILHKTISDLQNIIDGIEYDDALNDELGESDTSYFDNLDL